MHGLTNDFTALTQQTFAFLETFDIVALTETQLASEPGHLLPTHTIHSFGARRNAVAGEGLLLGVRNSLGLSVQKWMPNCGSSGAIWLSISGAASTAKCFLGVCYLPPANSRQLKSASVTRRLDALSREVAQARALGSVILGGDFNAQLGPLDSPAHSGHDLPPRGLTSRQVNQHGKDLVAFCDETQLILCTGRVSGDERAAPTWARAGSRSSRLDHMMVSYDAFHCIRSCHIRQGSAQLRRDSDHQPLEVRLQLSLRRDLQDQARPAGRRQRKLVWAHTLQSSYAAALQTPGVQQLLRSCASTSATAETADDVTAAARCLEAGVHKALLTAGARRTPATCRNGRHHRSAPWFDAECKAAHRRYCRARRRASDQAAFRAAETDLRRILRRTKRRWTGAKQTEYLRSIKSNSARMWRKFNQQRTGLPAALNHAAAWTAFRHKLASYQPPIGRHLPSETPRPVFSQAAAASLSTAVISQSEVLAALGKLQNGKASGYSEIPAEALRYAVADRPDGPPHELAPYLAQLFTAAFQTGSIPPEWATSLITPIYKKGDPLQTSNYRPVAVGPSFARLYAAVLDSRLSRYFEDQKLRAPSQAGFRPKRSVNHNLFALQHAIDKQRRMRQTLHTCFVDLSAAFDRVPRDLLWQRLEACGVNGLMLSAIKSLYRESQIAMKVDGCVGDSETTLSGVKQGCPLSPTLFGIFIDALEGCLEARVPDSGVDIRRQSVGDGPQHRKLRVLIYADDIVMLATCREHLQALLDALSDFCSAVGLTVNPQKTQVMQFVCGRNRTASAAAAAPFMLAGSRLPFADRYKYLGVTFCCSGNPAHYMNFAHQTLDCAYYSVRRRYSGLGCGESLRLQLHFFEAIVSSAASYAGELWGLHPRTKAARKRLDRLHSKRLKAFIRVPNCVPAGIVHRELAVQSLSDRWLRASLRFWNQLLQLPDGDLYRDVLFDNAQEALAGHGGFVRGLNDACRAISFSLEIDTTRFRRVDVPHVMGLQERLQRTQEEVTADICPRTCPSDGAASCKYIRWFSCPQHQPAPASLYDLPASARKLQQLLRFRLGCHSGLPIVSGRRRHVPREDRTCKRCLCALGDEKHLVFECPALHDIRENFSFLYAADARTNMRIFMNQPNQKGVLDFITTCFEFDSYIPDD